MSDETRINQVIDSTVQGAPQQSATENGGTSVNPLGVLMMLSGADNSGIPPWWSYDRDKYLRNLVTKSDHLAGALYNFSIKLRTIPLKIMARNESIRSHVSIAESYEKEIMMLSDFGKGFDSLFSKWIDDYHTQDNGAFLEVIAGGPKNEAVRGRVLSLSNLDSANCIRTRDPIYPVIYKDPESGKSYKLHHTRVVAMSQRTSPIWNMNGVGFCTVSSIVNTIHSLLDLVTYKREMIGAKPSDKFVVTGGGLDPEDVRLAMSLQQSRDSNSQLSRYSNIVIAGNRNIQDPKFDIYSFNKMPEWFREKEATTLSIAVIAMGFGMDARELFPTLEAGATKADAIISHIKQRGKGSGHVLTIFENILNTYVLPQFLIAKFDYQDDSEDRQEAEIRTIRAQGREKNLKAGITSRRAERQLMLRNGEVTMSIFEDLELSDGRLPSGVDVDVLFESDDPDYIEWLSDVTNNNWKEARRQINKFLINSRDEEKIIKARRALAAIKFKFDVQEKGDDINENDDDELDEESDFELMPDDESYEDEKYNDKLPKMPITAEDETQNYQ